jgi:hypothetical protein
MLSIPTLHDPPSQNIDAGSQQLPSIMGFSNILACHSHQGKESTFDSFY